VDRPRPTDRFCPFEFVPGASVPFPPVVLGVVAAVPLELGAVPPVDPAPDVDAVDDDGEVEVPPGLEEVPGPPEDREVEVEGELEVEGEVEVRNPVSVPIEVGEKVAKAPTPDRLGTGV